MKNTHNFSASLVMPQKARILGSILMGAALWGILGGEAKAQTPNPETAPAFSPPDNEKRAIDLFDKGMAAKKQNDWVSARDFFKQSLEAWPHWKTAANLGETELQLGRARDAAEHLDWALWELTKSREDAAALSAVQAKLDEAKLKAVTITLVTKDGGVDLYVDGKYVGKSPLSRPVYVEAGTRVFEGKKANGEVAREEGVFGFGMARELRLEGFGKVGESVGRRELGETEGRGWKPPLWWIGVGGGLGAVGIGLGIGYTMQARQDANEAERISADIQLKWNALEDKSGVTELEDFCSTKTVLGACEKWTQLKSQVAKNNTIAMGSFIAGGAAMITTAILIVTPYLLWREPSKKKISGQIDIIPVVAPYQHGILLRGAF